MQTPTTTTLRIEGMSCDGCAESITRALKRRADVESVRVDFAQGEARVTGTISRDELLRVIRDLEYSASVTS